VLVGPGGASGYTLDDARGVAVTQAGEVLVVEAGKKQVTRFDPNGVPLGRVGGPGDTEGQLLEPVAVAILDDGSLHVLDAERGTVQVYGPDGRYRERYGGEQRMYRPRGLARGDDDLIYVADTGGSRVVRFEANGAFHDLLPAEGADRALFDQPTAAVLSDGLLHVAEPTRQRLTILDPAGQRAATPWPMPETDTLRSSRLVIGVDGHLVITDVGARRIVIACSSDGPYLAWQPPDGLFDRMLAAALGPDRRLYIVDGAGRLARAQVELTC
jgi:tripartite motif-containing protein 71